MSRVAPFGFWDSPITPASMAAHGRRFGDAAFDAAGRATWVESRPAEGGRAVVMRRREDGSVEELVPQGFSARSRVYEYGGRAHALDGDALWAADFATQRLHRDGVPVSVGEGWRFAEPAVDRARGRVIATAERHASGERYPENGIASVDARTGEVRWLARGHDFYASPQLSPDGRALAFVAWDHPHMRWDAAALYVSPIAGDGSLGEPVRVAGGPDGSVNDLCWRGETELVFAWEVDDRWRPHAWDGRAVTRLAEVPGEVGSSLWSLGTRSLSLAMEDEVLCVTERDGRSLLVSIDLRRNVSRVLREDLPHIGHLDARGDEVLMVVGYNGVGAAVLRYDRARGMTEVIAGALPEGDAPEAISFATGEGDVAHGLFHAPSNAAFVGPAGALPPLIVTAHGGPTGAASPLPAAHIRFWTSRGFAVLDVNYRGSTGYGRAYRERLRAQWGVRDVADCVMGARHVIAAGRVRGDACFIRGASAGGYTVLQALCDHDVFRGGACHYGVSDPRSMTADTHKLESHYDRFLFGEGEVRERAFTDRAPLAHPERIRAPVIFFMGEDDRAVPPSQMIRIHDALRENGIESAYHGYPGEGHGFRRAETIADVWAKELAFYQRLLG